MKEVAAMNTNASEGPVQIDALLPLAMEHAAEAIGVRKTTLPAMTTFTLAVLAGAFVAAGFEHSVANMYFIQVGLLVKDLDPGFASTTGGGTQPPDLASLLPGQPVARDAGKHHRQRDPGLPGLRVRLFARTSRQDRRQ
jgi:hypothetical protein